MTLLKKFFTATRLRLLWTLKWEILAMLAGVAIFVQIANWAKHADPTASPADLGTLTLLWLPAIIMAVGGFIVWVALNVGINRLDRYADGDDEDDEDVALAEKRSLKRDWLAVQPAVRLILFFSTLGVLWISFITLAVAVLL